jgi:hypothetical protein
MLLQKNEISVVNKALLIAVIFTPIIVDQINGFLFFELGLAFSVSQMVKSFIFLSSLVIVCFVDVKSLAVLIAFFVLFLLTNISNIYIDKSRLAFLYDDFVFFTKVLTLPVTFYFFSYIFKRFPDYFQTHFRKLYLTLCLIFFCAILLAPLGLGVSTYGVTEDGVSIGYRGYFIAGNELSGLFILLFTFWIFDMFYYHRKFGLKLAGVMMGMAVGALIATKTALASTIMILIAVPLCLKFFGVQKKEEVEGTGKGSTKYIFELFKVLFSFFFLTITVFLTLFKRSIDVNIARLQGNLEDAENLNSFLLSGRNMRFDDAWRLFHHYGITEKLFGTGWNHPQEYIKKYFSGWGTAEVDYLDMLIATGIFGVIIIYTFWFSLLINVLKILFKKESEFNVPIFMSFSILFLNSFLSGHILYSALVGFYLGFLINGKNVKQ